MNANNNVFLLFLLFSFLFLCCFYFYNMYFPPYLNSKDNLLSFIAQNIQVLKSVCVYVCLSVNEWDRDYTVQVVEKCVEIYIIFIWRYIGECNDKTVRIIHMEIIILSSSYSYSFPTLSVCRFIGRKI